MVLTQQSVLTVANFSCELATNAKLASFEPCAQFL